MGEILGIGLSHFPGPLVPAKYWPQLLRTNVEKGRIPTEVFADRERWPAPMRAEWGADEGVTAAGEHEARLLVGYRKLRAELDAFNPDFLLIWGDDQYENFKKDCIPAFCVYILDEAVSTPLPVGRMLFKTEENAWGLPPESEFRVRGHREAASALASTLLNQGYDVAYAYATRYEHGLAHAHALTILYLVYDRNGFDYPVVPFHVNCYGNQMMQTAASAVAPGDGMKELSPPSPTPRRCFDIGRATARALAESPWRVAVIGSSSWSHASLTPKHDRLYPDMAADRARYEDLKNGRFRHWDELKLPQIEDSGQHEILNWVCLAGAMTELGQEPRIIDYVESYVFNSNKCFAVFPPRSAMT